MRLTRTRTVDKLPKTALFLFSLRHHGTLKSFHRSLTVSIINAVGLKCLFNSLARFFRSLSPRVGGRPRDLQICWQALTPTDRQYFLLPDGQISNTACLKSDFSLRCVHSWGQRIPGCHETTFHVASITIRPDPSLCLDLCLSFAGIPTRDYVLLFRMSHDCSPTPGGLGVLF